MNLTEMEDAVSEAQATLRRADMLATTMARLLTGRLRKVDSAWLLADLKRELRNFNSQTGVWK